MGRALSKDLRVRLVQAYGDGLSARQAALRFGVAASTAVRLGWVSWRLDLWAITVGQGLMVSAGSSSKDL